MIRIVVKGPAKSAKREAARHGVSLKHVDCTMHMTRRQRECKAEAACSSHVRVANWYGGRGTTRAGRGFPPGTLLHFNAASCGVGFGGARRRRKRRRR